MAIDYSQAGDINYVIGYAVSIDFNKARDLTAQTYKVNANLISTPKELTNYLVTRYNNGLDILKVFNQIKMPSENMAGGKPFGETFVGSLLTALLFPEGSGSGNDAPPPQYEGVAPAESMPAGTIAIWLVGGAFLLIIVIWGISKLTAKG